jgi:hypothetical protein
MVLLPEGGVRFVGLWVRNALVSPVLEEPSVCICEMDCLGQNAQEVRPLHLL